MRSCRSRGTSVLLAAADCKLEDIRLEIHWVQAAKDRGSLATRGGCYSKRVLVVRENGALLITDSQEHLLSGQTCPFGMRALAILSVDGAADIKASTWPDIEDLIRQVARPALAAAERRGADGRNPIGQHFARLVAQAGKLLLIVTAKVVVILNFHWSIWHLGRPHRGPLALHHPIRYRILLDDTAQRRGRCPRLGRNDYSCQC